MLSKRDEPSKDPNMQLALRSHKRFNPWRNWIDDVHAEAPFLAIHRAYGYFPARRTLASRTIRERCLAELGD